jgi:hypothetical protein
MTGKEMLINNLIKALGIDNMVADQLIWAIEVAQTFDVRIARIEKKIDILIGVDNAPIDIPAEFRTTQEHGVGTGAVEASHR